MSQGCSSSISKVETCILRGAVLESEADAFSGGCPLDVDPELGAAGFRCVEDRDRKAVCIGSGCARDVETSVSDVRPSDGLGNRDAAGSCNGRDAALKA